MKRLKSSKYRYLIPNGVTFLSLICGIVSILASAEHRLELAGTLILVAYILDLFDGELARRLNAGSEFGLHLDSLVDMVSLGTAGSALLFAYLRSTDVPTAFVWPAVILLPLAGAFRLARFNQLPAKKQGQVDSVGLTISTGSAVLTQGTLTALHFNSDLPNMLFLPFILIVSALMVSRISFPPLSWMFPNLVVSSAFIGFWVWSSFKLTFVIGWLILTTVYLVGAVAREGYRRFTPAPIA